MECDYQTEPRIQNPESFFAPFPNRPKPFGFAIAAGHVDRNQHPDGVMMQSQKDDISHSNQHERVKNSKKQLSSARLADFDSPLVVGHTASMPTGRRDFTLGKSGGSASVNGYNNWHIGPNCEIRRQVGVVRLGPIQQFPLKPTSKQTSKQTTT